MLKTFKKSIALFVALVFVLSLVPFSAFADTEGESEVIIRFTKPAFSRSKKTHQAIKTYPAGNEANNYIQYSFRNGAVTENTNVSLDNEYYAYTQFDFTGYEAIINDADTEYLLDLRAYGTGNYSMQDFAAYAMQDAIEDYDDATIAYADAKKQGLHNVGVRGTLIASDADTTKKGSWQGPIDMDAVKSVLNQGYDNSVVTVVFKTISTATASRLYYNNPNAGLHITYDPANVSNQEYVDSVLANINNWNDFTGKDDITETGLPIKYRGMNVTWTSSNPDVVSAEGVITQRPEAQDVTLTATFSYAGADERIAAATGTKEFVISVDAETPVEVMVPLTNYAYSRSSGTGVADAKSYAYGVLSADGVANRSIITGGSYEAYAQLDLKGYEEILKNPHTSVQMSLKAGFRYSGSRIYNLKATLAPDKADSYNWETITWNKAKALGLHNDDENPVLFIKDDDVRKSQGTVVVIDSDKEALLSVLGENDTNSLVSMHFVALDWGGTLADDETSDSTFVCNTESTGLIIKYYPSEIDNDAYLADIEDTFAWDTITADSQNAVVNNLPTYYKGADIVWLSAEGYVTSSGELAIPEGNAIVEDTVTANVSYNGNTFTKEFAVKLCDGSFTLGTPALVVEGGVATGSFAVTNATGEDAKYQLYLVVYSGDEMTNLVPVTLTATKGAVTSETLTANVAQSDKVKLLVWEYGKTVPATVAAVK